MVKLSNWRGSSHNNKDNYKSNTNYNNKDNYESNTNYNNKVITKIILITITRIIMEQYY